MIFLRVYLSANRSYPINTKQRARNAAILERFELLQNSIFEYGLSTLSLNQFERCSNTIRCAIISFIYKPTPLTAVPKLISKDVLQNQKFQRVGINDGLTDQCVPLPYACVDVLEERMFRFRGSGC